MTLAEEVKEIIFNKCPVTFSLYAGYGMNSGQYVYFPQGIQLAEKRNDSGRCILATYQYSDDSKLTYRYSVKTAHYTITTS